MVMPEVWVDCSKNPILEDLAIELNATGIIGRSSDVIKSMPANSVEVKLKSQKDVDNLAGFRGKKVPYIIADFPIWKAVPVENLISTFQDVPNKIAVRTNNPDEMKMFASALEVGVDAIVVSDERALRYACDSFKPNISLRLVDAKVTEVEQLGVGDRVCVDLITTQYEREGILVGSYANFMFLQDSETEKNPWVDTRDFRVNAGPGALYTLLKPGRTRYLKELHVGSPVTLVNAEGGTRPSYLVRSKIEKRPTVMIKAECEGQSGATVSQYAETVRIVSEYGSLPVTNIKRGDKLKAYVTKPVGMHSGKAVKESIVEK
jgi:3-dehydroquinate synthase II